MTLRGRNVYAAPMLGLEEQSATSRWENCKERRSANWEWFLGRRGVTIGASRIAPDKARGEVETRLEGGAAGNDHGELLGGWRFQDFPPGEGWATKRVSSPRVLHPGSHPLCKMDANPLS